MVGILIKVLVGVGLFAGSLVGGLAATGRLNHDGVANIPVLSALFPAPPTPEGEDAAASDAGHAEAAGDHAAAATEGVLAGEPGGDGPPRYRRAQYVAESEQGHGSGHGGGGSHGGGSHGGGDAAGAAGHPRRSAAADSKHRPQDPKRGGEPAQASAAHRDFVALAEAQGKTGYQPGGLFQFEGMPAGITPAELNAAWRRVQDAEAEVQQRQVSLDLREQELQELADDISRRQKGLGELQLSVENMHKQLDEKIARFERTVILVKDEEVAKLKENAATLASFESSKSAELVQQQWSTEAGQRAILRLLRFMEKESVNEILSDLPNPMVQDIMEKRMRVSREAAAPTGRD